MSTYQQKIYQENISKNQGEVKRLATQRNAVAVIRILTFISTLVCTVHWSNARDMTWMVMSLLIGSTAFLVFLKKFGQLNQQLAYHRALITINEREITREKGELKDEFIGGSRFVNPQHAYAYDLDVFGSLSLFSILNRCSTLLGENKLADWLKGKATKTEILARQKAVQELNPMITWRQDFQAYGMVNKSDEVQQFSSLIPWLKSVDQHFFKQWLVWGSKLAPAITVLGIAGYFLFDLSPIIILIGLIGNFILIRKTANKITVAVEKADESVKSLKAYATLMALFEKQTVTSEKLKQLQAKLLENQSGSAAIGRLAQVLYHLEMRKNAYFYLLVNVFLLYDVQWMIELEKWKRNYAAHIEDWLAVIAEIEALQSIAGYAYSMESPTYPTITDEPFVIKATALGHPLIPANKRVCNDFELGGKGKTAVITGSNMSGKSTFERTLGVNMILAFAGAPVCAAQFSISLQAIFTSMRVQDSLEENVSGFYAELRRIQQLLELLAAENAEPVFYLLDEVLKGTNSKDRQNGARALIKQLSQTNSFGLISTHDLELGELAEKFPNVSENFSFNSQIEGGKLSFDYKISKGLCHSFSATKLMQSIGIAIDDE